MLMPSKAVHESDKRLTAARSEINSTKTAAATSFDIKSSAGDAGLVSAVLSAFEVHHFQLAMLIGRAFLKETCKASWIFR